MSETVSLSCCVNDEVGSVVDRVSAIHVQDISLADTFRGLKFTELEGAIKIGHLTIRYSSWCPYVGNLLWNSYEIGKFDALKLLRYLHKRRSWHLEEAPEEFWVMWKTGRIKTSGFERQVAKL